MITQAAFNPGFNDLDTLIENTNYKVIVHQNAAPHRVLQVALVFNEYHKETYFNLQKLLKF